MSPVHRGPRLDRRSMLAGVVSALCLRPRASFAQAAVATTSLGERVHVIEGLGGNVVVWSEDRSAA